MYKTLFILATFSLLSLTVTASLSLPFKRSLQASNDGIIPITGPGNFVVSANLGSKSTNSTNSTSANMLLGLYTSRSLLASSCIGFTGYAPENYGYQASPNKSHISFLNFNVTGQFMSTNVVLDSGYWSLNTNGILATECSSLSDVSYNNTGVSGVLGLGFANNSASNYAESQPLFSIYIDQDGQSGELLFFSNLTKATTNVPLASLQTDSNWHITGLTSIVFNSSNSQTLDVSDYEVSFDLNSDAIGFPTAIYNNVLQLIQQAGKSLSCNNSIYLPTCTYNGNLDDLPVIQVNAGGAVLPIYPEIYVANSSQFTNGAINGQITLNIKEVSSNLTGVNYVSATYNDFIIMDAHVLTYFYIVFSGNSTESTGTVSVYIANRGTQGLLDEGNPTLYIVLGVVIVLLLAGASYWFFVRRTKQIYDGEGEYEYGGRGSLLGGRGSLLDDGLHSQL